MIFFISSFEIINVLMADPSILLWIAASDAVNPNGIKTLLVNGSSPPDDLFYAIEFALSARSRFPVKLICCIAFELASRACCLLKSIAFIL